MSPAIEETAVDDVETDMVAAVEHGVDGVAGVEIACRAVVLHEMEAPFPTVLIVAVQLDEARVAVRVRSYPAVDVVEVGGIERAVVGHARGLDGIDDHVVDLVGRTGTAVDVLQRDAVVQPRILNNDRYPCVQPRSGRANDRR